MGAGLSDRLWLWVAVPLALLVLDAAVASQMPDHACGEGESGGGATEVILIAVVLASAVAALGAGLFRLGLMALRRRYGKRDAQVLAAAALAVLATIAVRSGENSAGEALFIAGFVLPVLAFLALAVAVTAGGRSVDGVGIILPIYLFGAAYIYLAVGVLGLLASSGFGC